MLSIFPSAGTTEQADGHRGFQWNHSDLRGGVWNTRTLQQRIHRHVPHIRQQHRDKQVRFSIPDITEHALNMLANSKQMTDVLFFIFFYFLLQGFKTTLTSCSQGWRRSTAARRSWRKSWGWRHWLTWRWTRRWTVWSLTLYSSGRYEINTCCKFNPQHHTSTYLILNERVKSGYLQVSTNQI